MCIPFRRSDGISPAAEGYAHRDVAKLKAIKSNDPQDSGLCTKAK